MTDQSKKRGGARPGAGRKPKDAPQVQAVANKPETSDGPKEPYRWKPGQSGNPSGRPKVIGEIRDLARAHTVDALETLLAVMSSKEAPPAARVSAAAHILDRGYGKPQQSVVNTIRDARRLTDDELYAYIIDSSGGDGAVEAEENPGLAN